MKRRFAGRPHRRTARWDFHWFTAGARFFDWQPAQRDPAPSRNRIESRCAPLEFGRQRVPGVRDVLDEIVVDRNQPGAALRPERPLTAPAGEQIARGIEDGDAPAGGGRCNTLTTEVASRQADRHPLLNGFPLVRARTAVSITENDSGAFDLDGDAPSRPPAARP
jgi:hypothetical protein